MNNEIEDQQGSKFDNSIDQLNMTPIEKKPNNSRIYILLKCAWNVYRDRPLC